MTYSVLVALALFPAQAPDAKGPIRLLDGSPNQSKSFICKEAPAKPTRGIDASWEASIAEGGEGYALVVCPKDAYEALQKSGKWERPDLNGVFGVAFSVHNPKTENIFNGDGNIYGRPEREVSLHWDGFEVANKVSPVEFRGGKHRIHVREESVVGGAEVTVEIDKTAVYDRFFVPMMQPFAGLAAFGGRTSAAVTTLDLDEIKVDFAAQRRDSDPTTTVHAFDKVLNDAGHTSNVQDVDFPASTKGVGRVICTLRLDRTPKGLDPWDRCASIYVTDEKGEKFEIVRYITPYSRAYTWKVDVTDYLPLLSGRRKVELACTTYSQGWLVSVDFRLLQGSIARCAVQG